MDYRALGLKVGLEIHQQLATHKLFCEDVSALVDTADGQRFRRRLRPTQSELGEVDAAALEEAKRRLTFVYEATPNSCLVEADEEPPHPPNPEALDITLEIALLLDAKPVNEVDFMRKIVIDGSNTAGVQRSGLVAIEGGARIEIKGVQELRLIATFVEKEVERQAMLIEVAAELKKRNVTSVPIDLRDLTPAFRETESKVVQTALKAGGVVLGWALPGFAGLLKAKLGPELAAHARVAGVAGIFHSDELPGKARMYPETDVPPIRVTAERLRRIREHLPERPDVTVARLARDYGIHEQQARQLVQEGGDAAFEMIAHEFGEAKLVASVLLYTFGELRREGLDVDGIPVDHLRELFSLLKAGRFAKEALPELVREMERTRSRASEAIKVLGVTQMSGQDLESIVDEVLRSSQDLVSSRGDAAEKALMGQVMKRVRGRADGKLVSQVLHERLETHLTEKPKGRKKKR